MKKIFITILGIVTLIVAGCQKEKEVSVPLSIHIGADKVEIGGSTAEVVKADTVQLVLFRDTVTNDETDTVYNIHTSLRLLLDKTFEADKMEDTLHLEFLDDIGASLVTLTSSDSMLADSLVAFLNRKPNESIEIEFAGQIEKSKYLQLSNVAKVVLQNFSFHLDPEAGLPKIIIPVFMKFVRVDNGAVIRKSPSDNALRLVTWTDEEAAEESGGDSNGVTVTWESPSNRRFNPKQVNAEVVPVIEEDGEWYKVYYSNGERWGVWGGFSDVAYIAKKYCHDVALDVVPFTPSKKASQMYKNCYLGSECFGDCVLLCGRYRKGMLIELASKSFVGAWEVSVNDKENPTDAEIKKALRFFTNKADALTYRVKGIAKDFTLYHLKEYNGPTKEL